MEESLNWISNELEEIDKLLRKGKVEKHEKNFVISRLSVIMEVGIKKILIRVLTQFGNNNKFIEKTSHHTHTYPLTLKKLRQFENKEISLEELIFEDFRHYTNFFQMGKLFSDFFDFDVISELDLIYKNTDYKNKLNSFISERNKVSHELYYTDLTIEKLLEISQILAYFLKDLLGLLIEYAKFIEEQTDITGKLSKEDKMQIRNKFIKKNNHK